MHSHDHSHHHHDHGHAHHVTDTVDGRRRVALAAILTFGFMIAEVVGGLISGSLALLADAAHMLTDAGALALAWIGFKLAERPADQTRSFGWARFKVLAAFVNGLTLIVLAGWIVLEAAQRLLDPQEVMGSLLLGVAILGLAVNLIAFRILHGGDQEDLNMRAALWHVAGDLLGSVAAIAAALIIMSTGWMPIDPILSVLVALIILVGGVRVVRSTAHILIEGVPPGLTIEAIKSDLESELKDAARVDHIHAWALNESKTLVTLDVEAGPGACIESLRQDVKARLKAKFQIDHVTVEIRSKPTRTP
ncbi:MAG: cation diffusion facilitator family transporter [Hyphomonas sp.]|nr:cation diffusion facilitator family transporter [Hyphomonas sp.]